jgi:seryl-tRNA synthetase
MLDIKFIRESPELIRAGAAKKGITFDLDRLLELDVLRRGKIQEVEGLRAEQNRVSEEVKDADAKTRETHIGEMRELKARLEQFESELKTIEEEYERLMLQVPNVPDLSVPEGEADADNQEVKKWGHIRDFGFTPKNHIDLMLGLDMVDLDRGAKVAGFRGYFLKNMGARLAWAIWRYAEDFFLEKGFTPILAPSLVKRDVFLGSG